MMKRLTYILLITTIFMFSGFNVMATTSTNSNKSSITNPNMQINQPTEQPKKLKLSTTNKEFLGVCGGFAEYFNIDATIIRIAWTVSILFFGTGLLLYFICYLCMK